MSKLTFHKSSSAPTTDAGAIWFDSTNKQIKIKDISGWETYSVSSIPSSLPASDVYEWAKAKTKPTYTYSEVGAAAAAHHHTIADVDGLQTALDAKISSSEKGSNNGVAQLDENGRVPSSQLPSYVDDVIEASGVAAFPQTGEAGKIYVDTKTNLTYRWSGTTYVEISPSLALGETSSTAYAGDKGAATTSKVNTHVANTDIHITADERTKWNSAATNSHKLYKANECEDYTSDDGGLTPAAVKKLADKKLSLSGGTMSGNIALPNNAGIIQTQDSTSNSTTAITWLTGGVGTFYTDADGTSKKYKYQPHISQHNTGGASGTGSITLAPYPTNLAPWEKKVGLYISEDEIKYKGKDLVTSDQVPTNTVVSGQYSAMMTDDRKLFLAEDCDALYSANKRFTVTLTNNGNKIDNNCNELFDGSIESVVALSAGTNVILIDCGDNFEWTYGEGWLLTNFYHTFVPTSVSARIYSNTSGWSNVTMEHKGGGGAQWYEGATPVIIRISKIEVTIEVAENSTCQLNSLLYILRRPDHHSSSVRKYQPETLYHNLTVPSLTVNGTNFSGKISELSDFTSAVYSSVNLPDKIKSTTTSDSGTFPVVFTNSDNSALSNSDIYANPNTGMLSGRILNAGRYYSGVAQFAGRGNYWEMFIKTRIPYENGDIMWSVFIKGFAYLDAKPINISIHSYLYNNMIQKYVYQNYGGWAPDAYYCTYTENEKTYWGIVLQTTTDYFNSFVVDFLSDRDIPASYISNWSIEFAAAPNTLLPENASKIPLQPLNNSITGSANSLVWAEWS